MNKKGDAFAIILLFLVLFIILIVGFGMAVTSSIFNFVGDEVTPIFQELGMAGNINLSEVAEYSIVPLNTVVQNLSWLVGFAFVVMISFSIIFAVSFRSNPHPVFIAFYIFLTLLLIVGSIILSNMYEDIYTGDDEIATRLQEHTLLSYMILHSPLIMGVIALITGIFLFSGKREQEYIA